jgi:hypothetical protein
MLSYARDLMQKYDVCYSVGITLENNNIAFRKNGLPCQPHLKKCLTKPLTIMTITGQNKDCLDFLLIKRKSRNS